MNGRQPIRRRRVTGVTSGFAAVKNALERLPWGRGEPSVGRVFPEIARFRTTEQVGIGLVAPFDFALDRELWRWLDDRACLHSTRLPYLPEPVTVRLATALADPHGVRRATRDVLAPDPHVVAYSCTSGSFAAGAAGEATIVAAMLAAGAPAAVTTSGALVGALTELGIGRVAIVSPYVAEVTERLLDFLSEFGVTTTANIGLGMLGDIWKLSYSDVLRAVAGVDTTGAEALFVACTNVPTYDIIAPLERLLSIPVLTANQVTMWAAQRAAGVGPIDAPGLLFANGGKNLATA
ncbi:maleate cis-trans isomerase [Saccharomonospora marina XMU15]|uniref:Maleate cis-trans isomerase n=1 Tax=Saccharomonospora marina XMU15 TaxID=882083 RepID=H5X1C6_9PSEU|nr:maleate cis-trans isomerase [Saccharomonospora marina XMU15]